jgi:hypothetical protein
LIRTASFTAPSGHAVNARSALKLYDPAVTQMRERREAEHYYGIGIQISAVEE